MGHRPTRFSGDKSQLFLQRQFIDFVDHAINVIRQTVALLRYFLVKLNKARCTQDTLGLNGHWKAPSFEGLQQGIVVLKRCMTLWPTRHLA